MNQGGTQRTGGVRPVGVAARLGLLLLVVVAVYALMAPVAFYLRGASGVWAASVATGVCLFAALAALALTEVFRGPSHALTGVLSAMLVRMGIPLGFCLAVLLRRGELAESGVVIYLLIMYMATLAVETWMAVGQTGLAVRQANDTPAKTGER